MASKDQLRDEGRRTTLRSFSLPTAAEGAGRLFDWADALSSDARRAITLPSADWEALASDFAAVGHDFDVVIDYVLDYVRLHPEPFERDPHLLLEVLLTMLEERDERVSDQASGVFARRRFLRRCIDQESWGHAQAANGSARTRDRSRPPYSSTRRREARKQAAAGRRDVGPTATTLRRSAA
jgi:hypothetical protein